VVENREEILDLSEEAMERARQQAVLERTGANSPVIEYRGKFPSAAQYLMDEDMLSSIRQKRRSFHKSWAEGGVDIIYHLQGMTPSNFLKYRDTLLLAAYQEAKRYEHTYTHIGAGFDVKLIRRKGAKRDIPDVVTFSSSLRIVKDIDVMVYGPGYETPTAISLADKADQIADILKRYDDKVQKQRPFRVLRLYIICRTCSHL
jgi:hypothetical protein